MLTIKNQLSILVHLSKADKVVAEEEYKLIASMAHRSGLNDEDTADLFENPDSIPELRNLPPNDRFDHLINVIKLMKVDGKIHQNEIQFCEKLAMRLGYKPGVVANLSAHIYKDSDITTNRDHLMSIANQHLIRRDEDDN